jgi:hypothetical protein
MIRVGIASAMRLIVLGMIEGWGICFILFFKGCGDRCCVNALKGTMSAFMKYCSLMGFFMHC